MLRKIFTIAISISCLCAYSQDKNAILFGGGIGAMYSSSRISDLSQNNSLTNSSGIIPGNLIGTIGGNSGNFNTLYLELEQSIMVYLSDNFLVGLEYGFLSETNNYESDVITKSSVSSFLVSPCLRYFLHEGLYGQIQYNNGISNQKLISSEIPIPTGTGFTFYDYSTFIKANTNGFGISAGYLFPISGNMNLDFALRYFINKSNFIYDHNNEDLKYSITQSAALLSIGIKYKLNKTKGL